MCVSVCCRCVSGSYTSPTGTIRVDFESAPNEHRAETDLPTHIIDDSATLVKLDHVTVSTSTLYSLCTVLHLYLLTLYLITTSLWLQPALKVEKQKCQDAPTQAPLLTLLPFPPLPHCRIQTPQLGGQSSPPFPSSPLPFLWRACSYFIILSVVFPDGDRSLLVSPSDLLVC